MAQEIERKFRVLDDSFKALAYDHTRIEQGYICSGSGRTVRVRIRGDRGYLTIKGPSRDGGISRYEFETEVALADAMSKLADDEAFRTSLAARGEEYARRYSFENVIPLWEKALWG